MSYIFDFLIGTIVPFLLILSLVIFIHEMGHYLIGRLSGIRVLVFSIGFGPEIIGFTDGHGTRWKLSAIPLGGYVRFFGDLNAASAADQEMLAALTPQERRTAFPTASIGRRAATVAAGPIANFILAIVIFAASFYFYGRPTMEAVVSEVVVGSAASEAGIESGDVFLSADGQEIEDFSDLQRYVAPRSDIPIDVEIRRNGKVLNTILVPRRMERTDGFGNVSNVGTIGVQASVDQNSVRVERYGLGESFVRAGQESWFIAASTFRYIADIFRGREKADQLGGPIRIAEISGQVATLGFLASLHLAAVLSVSIGLLNLLPIPILDGGHLLFYAIEAVRGRPLSEKSQEIGFRIGLTLVLMLMLFATWNDITRFT